MVCLFNFSIGTTLTYLLLIYTLARFIVLGEAKGAWEPMTFLACAMYFMFLILSGFIVLFNLISYEALVMFAIHLAIWFGIYITANLILRKRKEQTYWSIRKFVDFATRNTQMRK